MDLHWLLIPAMFACGCNSEKIARLEQENKRLAERLDAVASGPNLDLQEKCAQRAAQYYSDAGYGKEPMAGYRNHYNNKLRKCFISIAKTLVEEKGAHTKLVSVRLLTDVFEERRYGRLVSTVGDAGASICEVTTSDGRERECKTPDEYEELIKPFMNQ